jgi:uncharacterized protein (DUF1697 family)
VASIALLRAVNVGGRNPVPMAGLRAVFEHLGCADVRTYVQSGNVVFRHPGKAGDTLAARVEAAIAQELGTQTRVILRSPAELARALRASPWAAQAAAAPATVHIAFLAARPRDPHALDGDTATVAPDRFAVHGREAHLWYPNGAGRSKLTNALMERRLGVSLTSRNWNTVTKLLALAREVS